MLLIDHHNTQLLELNIVFDQCMRPDDDVDAPIHQPGMNLPSLFDTCTSGQ